MTELRTDSLLSRGRYFSPWRSFGAAAAQDNPERVFDPACAGMTPPGGEILQPRCAASG